MSITAWGDAIVMGGGIMLFLLITLHVYRRSARTEQSDAARLPFALKDELDG